MKKKLENNLFFLFLDQENLDFSLAEVETYYVIKDKIGPLILVDNLNFKNLALVKYYGKLLDIVNDIEEIDLSSYKGKKVGIKVLGNRKNARDIQKYLVKKFNLFFSFDQQTTKILIFFYEDFIYIGEIIKEREKFTWREPKNRPFNMPYTLKPKFAKTLVNLANDSFIVDPFCGTGTILIESFFLKKSFIGIDRDWKAVKGCITNLKFFNAPPNVILSNAFYINNLIKKPFSVVCDPPYGKSSTSFKKDIFEVYEKFLESLFENNNLNNVVILAPKHFKEVNSLILTYKPCKIIEHFVNKSLIRVIYVFRKSSKIFF